MKKNVLVLMKYFNVLQLNKKLVLCNDISKYYASRLIGAWKPCRIIRERVYFFIDLECWVKSVDNKLFYGYLKSAYFYKLRS